MIRPHDQHCSACDLAEFSGVTYESTHGVSMFVKDWVKEAAYQIYNESLELDHVEEIIRHYCPFKQDTAYVPVDEARCLTSLLIDSKRDHTHCEDSWYCCGKCQAADHLLSADEWLPPNRYRTSGVCNCGADAWNQRVDEAVTNFSDYSTSQDVGGGTAERELSDRAAVQNYEPPRTD